MFDSYTTLLSMEHKEVFNEATLGHFKLLYNLLDSATAYTN